MRLQTNKAGGGGGAARRARRHAAAWFCAIALGAAALGSTSCALFQPPSIIEEGDFVARARVKVEAADEAARSGRGRARPRPQPAGLSALQREVFVAEGQGAFPANASSGVQRLAVARAEALRAAQRALARQVLEFELDGRALSELAPSRETLAADLSSVIEAQAQIEYLPSAEGVTARATLPGEAAHRGLGMEPMRETLLAAPEADASAAPSEEARKRAERLGANAAREMLREEILNTPASGGQTLRSLFARRASAAERLETMLEQTQPSEVNFTPDGFCEVALALPRARVAELLR